jgi:hypothetical protein
MGYIWRAFYWSLATAHWPLLSGTSNPIDENAFAVEDYKKQSLSYAD